MGAGIAQVAASAGHPVTLIDISIEAASQAKESIRTGLEGLVKRGKKTQNDVEEILERLRISDKLNSVADSGLVVEAIVEDLLIKRNLLKELESFCADDTIIASNTSSISISAIAANAKHPQRVVGMHFFNPAAILKLVEVVSGLTTSSKVAEDVFNIAKDWGKHPVHVKSTPGFIVNRVARPFYAEALRSINEVVTTPATLDEIMRSCGQFKMGPLELTDLIGQDVNCAVTESVYDAFYQDKRYLPSIVQKEMVDAGLLGRKSGQGFYDYKEGAKNARAVYEPVKQYAGDVVVIEGKNSAFESLYKSINDANLEHQFVESSRVGIRVGTALIRLTDGRTATSRANSDMDENLILLDYASDYGVADTVAISVSKQASREAQNEAISFLQGLGKNVCVIKDVPGMQVLRTLAMICNEAFDAVDQGVCDKSSVDIAMRAGVAYPKGPFEWASNLDVRYLYEVLKNIKEHYGEERYRVSPLLTAEAL